MSHKGIIKSAGVIGIATLLSRVLGLIRDILFAAIFGTTASAQAFIVAFRIPNILRDLVGEGAANSALVPVFSEYLLKSPKEFLVLISGVFNLTFICLSVITLLGIWQSPLIVRIIAPGFLGDREKISLTISLTRIMFPYLLLVGLAAFSMGVLHTMRYFAAPSFGPCIFNVVFIVCLCILKKFHVVSIYPLAWAVLIGGLCHFAIQIPYLKLSGFRLDVGRQAFSHSAIKRLGVLLLPRFWGAAVHEVSVFVDTICSTLTSIVGEGAVAAIYYASRLMQLPLAIFGLSLSSAILPTLSTHVADKNLEQFRKTLCFSLRNVFLLMAPACVGFLVLSGLIVKAIFQRGEFTSAATSMTSSVLFFYAFSLLGYGPSRVLISGFYSLQDTATPVKVALAALIVNIILNVVLMFPLKVGGLALATSISSFVNLGLLWRIMEKRVGDFGQSEIKEGFGKITLSAALMGTLIYVLERYVRTVMGLVGGLFLLIIAGIGSFLFFCYLLKVKEIRELTLWLKERLT